MRPTAPEDVPTLADIWIDAAFGESGAPPGLPEPIYLAHEIATGSAFVAEVDRQAVGFGAVLTRGEVSNLAELFVRRRAQSGGVGAALLEALLARAAPSRFTIASSDPRAVALYARHGMVPRWPYYYLTVEADRLRLPGADVAVAEASWDDPAWTAWDRDCAGRPRPEDHRYLREACAGVPLWFRRGTETVGYGCVQLPRSDQAAEAATIGPLGARDPDVAVACTMAAVRWAARHRRVLKLALPGAHAALASLLEAGFRIVDADTFMSTSPPAFVDPLCYIPIGAEFF
ncbi:MAG: GNAT family N-acetyltransferase [Alphaproteobacteria bacterium]